MLSLGFSPSFHTFHSTYISKGTGIAKRNEQHAGTMKPEFGSLQPAKGWEPGGAAFTGRQTGQARPHANLDLNCKGNFGMGLAGMGVPDHSHMPRADVLLLEHLVEIQRAV